MSFESRFWRSQIKRDLNFLERRFLMSTNNMNDAELNKHYSLIEIKLFIVAYSLRKLIDAKKLPDRVAKTILKVKMYRRTPKTIRYWHSFDDCYNPNNKIELSIEFRYLCNQFIHSFFFQPSVNRNGLIKSIFFVSDNDREKGIYCISSVYFIKKIRGVVDLYTKFVSISYSKKNRRDIVIVK